MKKSVLGGNLRTVGALLCVGCVQGITGGRLNQGGGESVPRVPETAIGLKGYRAFEKGKKGSQEVAILYAAGKNRDLPSRKQIKLTSPWGKGCGRVRRRFGKIRPGDLGWEGRNEIQIGGKGIVLAVGTQSLFWGLDRGCG